jgi:hypothetical protein
VEPGDGPQARLGVNGPITQTGRDAWGVYFRLLDATINSNITQRGANSLGIYADGLGYSPVLLHSTGSITSSGDNSNGIFAQQMLIGFDPNAFIRVRSDGAITMTGRNATGALLDNYITPDESLEEIFGYPYFFGAANVAATFNGEVKSTGAGGRAIEILGREVTLNLNGDTLGGTDSAQRAGAGVVIRGSRQVTINNTGTLSSGNLAALSATSEGRAVTLNNSGAIIGSVWLNGARGANFNNSGQFWTSGLQMSAGGVLETSGFVGVAGGAAGNMDVRLGANVINSGTISLANGVAGDQLTIGGAIVNQRVVQAARTYSGTEGATLAIDAMLTGAGAADKLNLTGAVSGATNVAVTNLARGASTLTPTFIPVVTGAAGASANAFSLQGGVIASGLTDWSLEQRGDTFGLASRVNAARAGDAARAGLRAMNIFNLITAPDVGGAGGPGGASGSAVLNYAPAPQANSASAPFGAFDAKAGVEPARDATAIAHLGAIHQRAKADGDDTKASAFFGGLDVVWGALKGPAPRVTAGIFGGYSSGTSDMAGGSRAVTKANSLGARVRYDVDGWFAGAAARGGLGDMKYTIPGARGDGEVSFSALDAFMGRRFDMAGNFYVQPSLMTTYAKVSSNTFNVGGAAMRIGESEWRYGGEVRVGRDGLLVGASGWSMDAWMSGGVWGSDSGGATQFAILALAPPSTGAIFSYGAGVAVKAPKDAVTMRLGAYGQAGAVRSFTIFGGVSMPFGG